MSQIENAASKWLKPMIGTNLVIHLDREAQTTLSTWSLLKGLLVPYYQRQPDMIPVVIYEEFFKQRRPSDQQRILLARHSDRRVSGGAHSYLLDLAEADGTTHSCCAYAVTFHIERLVVHLFGHILSMQLEPEYSPVLTPYVIRIWPTNGLAVWPPPQRLDVAGLMALRRAFA
jgi:hypothetical protein